jgi:hypothetical protein
MTIRTIFLLAYRWKVARQGAHDEQNRAVTRRKPESPVIF